MERNKQFHHFTLNYDFVSAMEINVVIHTWGKAVIEMEWNPINTFSRITFWARLFMAVSAKKSFLKDMERHMYKICFFSLIFRILFACVNLLLLCLNAKYEQMAHVLHLLLTFVILFYCLIILWLKEMCNLIWYSSQI